MITATTVYPEQAATTEITTSITVGTLTTVLFMHQLVTSLVMPFDTVGKVSYWLWADGSRILWADGTAMRT